MEWTIPRNSWRERSRDILSGQVEMATFNGSGAAAGNGGLCLASWVGDRDSIYIFMQRSVSAFECSGPDGATGCRRDSRRFEAGVPEGGFPSGAVHGWWGIRR